MELSAIRAMLELAEGPAFALREGRLLLCNEEAELLDPEPAVLGALALPVPGEPPLESCQSFGGRSWTLRAVSPEPGLCLCFLRPLPAADQAPNEATLLHTAGVIRAAAQELTLALDALSEQLPGDDPSAAHSAALGLRGVYRLRRTAGELERFAVLRRGGALCRRRVRVVEATEALCRETAELLRSAGLRLEWSLPKKEFSLILDWPLIKAMLLELAANAAAHSADGTLRLELSRSGRRGLRFCLSNFSDGPLPEQIFHRHAAERRDLEPGLGLGLSLVSAGAAAHGGGFLLSADEEGRISALLSVLGAPREEPTELRGGIQRPAGPDEALTALSQVLPAELYRPEDLL